MSAIYSLRSVSHNSDQGTFMDRVIQITKNVRMETVKVEAERIEREMKSIRNGGLSDDVTTKGTPSGKDVRRKSSSRGKKEGVKLYDDVSDGANRM